MTLTPKISLRDIFGIKKPIIGMVHLLPLPGSSLYEGNMDKILERAIKDAESLEKGGMDGILIENMGDMTYSSKDARPELISSMTYIVTKVSKETRLPFGVCLLTDPVAALSIAHATGGDFLRATVYTDAVVDVSGTIESCAHRLQRLRKLIMADEIKVFADVHIKHSVPLAPKPIEYAAKDASYFLADAVIVSGSFTGEPTPLDTVKKLKKANPKTPIIVGSGITEENVGDLLKYADGAIVGTALKKEKKTLNPVSVKNVKSLMGKVQTYR